jgi:hypothetical protein
MTRPQLCTLSFVGEASLTKEFHDYAFLVAEGWEEES